MRCITLAAVERSAPYLEATAAYAESSAYGCWQHRTITATPVSFMAMDKMGHDAGCGDKNILSDVSPVNHALVEMLN